MNKKQVESDYLYCEAIIKKHSKSFYHAFSALPKEKAYAVYAIYAFCRIADDCVDETPEQMDKVIALQQLKKELDLFHHNQEVNHPLWRALRHVFDHFDMDTAPFYDQLAGQQMDVEFQTPSSLEELEHYSYHVAGSVGLMLLPIIASSNLNMLKEAAIDLGVAMQITNILRDIGEDFYDKNRIYIPVTLLNEFDYTVADLNAGKINESFIQLWEKLAIRAEYLYDSFSLTVDQFDSDSKVPVVLSAQFYRGILDVVRTNNYNCLSERNDVNQDRMSEINAEISSYS